MQERYWKYMTEIKTNIFYLDLYAEHDYKRDKFIRIWGAISSSASIAAWAILQQFSFVWAIIIAVSQVITAIKEFLPYSRRLKFMASFIQNLKLLYNEIEYNWFKIASGDMTEEEINELLYHFTDEYTKIENENLKEILLDNKKFMEKASQKADFYFSQFQAH